MRKPAYLSPSSLNIYNQNKNDYYLQYLADTRAPRMVQTRPMSIGSAFDAYVKSFLHENLFGKGSDPKFDFITLFEAQVDPVNRDWAIKAGDYCFNVYKRTGALSDLMLELNQSVGKPLFEIEIKGVIDNHREGVTKVLPGGVMLLGKPDVFFVNKAGMSVILDFKVNGYCSNYSVSPMPGYIRVRQLSGNHTAHHKDAIIMNWNGSMINVASYLNQLNEEWSLQLSIYSWLCGTSVGKEIVTAIDQLVCSPSGLEYPNIKVAQHRLRIQSDYQWTVLANCQELWSLIHIEPFHYFPELTLEESQERCSVLEKQAQALAGLSTTNDKWFAQTSRK